MKMSKRREKDVVGDGLRRKWGRRTEWRKRDGERGGGEEKEEKEENEKEEDVGRSRRKEREGG